MLELKNSKAFLSLSTTFLCSLLLFKFGHIYLALVPFSVFVILFQNLLNSPRKLKTPENFHVVIIGAGVSGICMGKKLNDIGVKYTVLEKSSRLGGTWWENTYPG